MGLPAASGSPGTNRLGSLRLFALCCFPRPRPARARPGSVGLACPARRAVLPGVHGGCWAPRHPRRARLRRLGQAGCAEVLGTGGAALGASRRLGQAGAVPELLVALGSAEAEECAWLGWSPVRGASAPWGVLVSLWLRVRPAGSSLPAPDTVPVVLPVLGAGAGSGLSPCCGLCSGCSGLRRESCSRGRGLHRRGCAGLDVPALGWCAPSPCGAAMASVGLSVDAGIVARLRPWGVR